MPRRRRPVPPAIVQARDPESGDQHLVDHVHDAVGGRHVRRDDGGTADDHFAAADADRERLALEGLRGVKLHCLGGGDLALDDVVEQHRAELRLILGERGEGRLRHLRKGGIGRGEHRERPVALERAGEACLRQQRGEHLELSGRDDGLNEVLLGHRRSGCGGATRGGDGECGNDCDALHRFSFFSGGRPLERFRSSAHRVTRKGIFRCPSVWVRGPWFAASIRVSALPAVGAGAALERADEIAGDPAAVEAAGLRLDELAVERAFVHESGVEGDGVADRLERRRRVGVCPGRPLDSAAVAADHVEVRRDPLPLAEPWHGRETARASPGRRPRAARSRRADGSSPGHGAPGSCRRSRRRPARRVLVCRTARRAVGVDSPRRIRASGSLADGGGAPGTGIRGAGAPPLSAYCFGGIRTLLMTWMTPFEAMTSAFVTRAPPT